MHTGSASDARIPLPMRYSARNHRIAGLALTAIVAAPWLVGVAQAAACPAERAVYAMKTEEGDFAAAFVPARSYASVASDLYFRLTTTQRDYWFRFAVSNGYSGITLIPVADPYAASAKMDGPEELLEDEPDDYVHDILRTLRFYPLDADLNMLADPPNRGDPAPAFVMVPEVGLTLWYEPSAISQDLAATRDPMPRGVFRQTACLDAPPPEAFP